ENLLVKVGKFTFPVDFVILEIEEDSKVTLILGRHFLHTADAIFRVKQKQLNLGVGTEQEDFDSLQDEGSKILYSIKGTILEEEILSEFDEFIAMTANENSKSESDIKEPPFEKITINTDYKIKTSLEEPPMDLELKPLLDNLEYGSRPQRAEPLSESEDSEGGHWKSKSRKQKSSMEEDDLSQPWTCEEANPFIPRIRYFKLPKKSRMPNNVKTYDGSDDPKDHLKIFQAAAKLEHSYDDLKKAFLANYLQQKKCIKDPVEIHHIKQRERESMEDSVQRFKAKSRHVKGAPECMRISGFMNACTITFQKGPGRPVQPARVCSYTDFMKCQPLNFKGTKGVVGLSRWFEKMESIFYISGCIRYLHSARPKALDDAIELANDLMDQKLCTYAERQSENKRKLDNNNQAQKQLLKKQNVVQAYVVGSGKMIPVEGSKLCA
ncbi:reverse transcriptase domain-containing protein, partial [Tanacetum coccineum]